MEKRVFSPHSNTVLTCNGLNEEDGYVIFSEHSREENEDSGNLIKNKRRNSTVLEGYEEDSEEPDYESNEEAFNNGDPIEVSLPNNALVNKF